MVKAGEKEVNLLEAGHRAGDALVRCSALQQELQDAFKAVLKGDAEPLAKIAPTSLVFGVWDSRDTQAKLPRLVASTIRAFDVRKLTRSAQFNPAAEYVNDKLLDEPADKATKDAYAERGFIHVPASGSHGGVIADRRHPPRRHPRPRRPAAPVRGQGRRRRPLALRRYILGLALTAFTHNPSGYLRQGCLLVLDPDKPREFVEVYPTGERKPATITHDDGPEYATAAAKAFGVGEGKTVEFDKERAKRDVKGEAAEGTTPREDLGRRSGSQEVHDREGGQEGRGHDLGRQPVLQGRGGIDLRRRGGEGRQRRGRTGQRNRRQSDREVSRIHGDHHADPLLPHRPLPPAV